jgi:plastocyanin
MRMSFKQGIGAPGIVLIIALIAIIGGFYLYQRSSGGLAQNSPSPSTTPGTTITPSPTPITPEVRVVLDQQNKSNEIGEATLSERLGKAHVVLVLNNAPTTAQPAHIHMGSCAKLGAVKYNLNPVTNGRSETDLEVSLAEVLSNQPIAVNVHKSTQQVNTYVSCGDVKATVEMGSEDHMISPSPSVSSTGSPRASVSSSPAAATTKTFNIVSKDYSFSQTSITVKKGDKVRINLSNTGGIHDWVLDEFNAKTKRITDGQSDSIEFVADKVGSFEFYCSVGSHRAMGMKGTLIVQ